ncbi:unnamed protein product [Peniophora sp. CBMAI 1063]|nr:unnamed protein product [Peniophora sp. CBMAI 1063]
MRITRSKSTSRTLDPQETQTGRAGTPSQRARVAAAVARTSNDTARKNHNPTEPINTTDQTQHPRGHSPTKAPTTGTQTTLHGHFSRNPSVASIRQTADFPTGTSQPAGEGQEREVPQAGLENAGTEAEKLDHAQLLKDAGRATAEDLASVQGLVTVLEAIASELVDKGEFQAQLFAVGELIKERSRATPSTQALSAVEETVKDFLEGHAKEMNRQFGMVHDKIKELDERTKTSSAQAEIDPKAYTDMLMAPAQPAPPAHPPPATTMQEARARSNEAVETRKVTYNAAPGPVPAHKVKLPRRIHLYEFKEHYINAIKDGKLEEMANMKLTVKFVYAARGGGVKVEMTTGEAAEWLRSEIGVKALEREIVLHLLTKEQLYNTMVQFVPLTFKPADADSLREMEQANGLPERSIARAQWIKPVERRKNTQMCAHLMISYRAPEPANQSIHDGLQICNKRLEVHRQRWEARQCGKCQSFDHLVDACTSPVNVCSTCGDDHYSKDCPRIGKLCVSCKDDGHCSWDHDCPEFRRRCEDYDRRHPENCRVYFPTNEAWTYEATIEPGTFLNDHKRHRKASYGHLAGPRRPTRNLGDAPTRTVPEGTSQTARRRLSTSSLSKSLEANGPLPPTNSDE